MKFRHFFYVAAFSAFVFAVSSCTTPKDITYFQDVTSGQTIQPLNRNDIKVRPEDKLSIVVSTQDPALSSMFNLVTTQNRIGSGGSGGSLGSSAGGGSGNTSLYTVDADGDINFPVLGRLHVADMNRTVVEAIAMAGDIGDDGMRQNVTVMREGPDGQQTVYKVDLTDMNQLSQSPVYYMQQNDVIYVEPNDKAKRNTTPNGNSPYTPAFWFSIASFALTIGTLVISLTK